MHLLPIAFYLRHTLAERAAAEARASAGSPAVARVTWTNPAERRAAARTKLRKRRIQSLISRWPFIG